MISTNDFYNFINKNYDLIDDTKLTSVKNIGFNYMEGFNGKQIIRLLLKNNVKINY